MANGDVHGPQNFRLGVMLTLVSGGAAFYYHPLFTGGVVGSWLGFLATPDLDHHYITECEKRIERFNPLLGKLWRIYWWPYMKIISHRSYYSHSWPVGTLIRFVYLLWFPLAYSAYYLAQVEPAYLVYWFVFWFNVFLSWSIQDIRHYKTDGLPWYGKRKTKRRRYNATAGNTDSLHP